MTRYIGVADNSRVVGGENRSVRRKPTFGKWTDKFSNPFNVHKINGLKRSHVICVLFVYDVMSVIARWQIAENVI